VKLGHLDGEARPTLRGLMTGFVKVCKDGKLKPCIVFGSAFPSWLPVLRELGVEPVLILLRSDACLEEVEAFVGDKCVILCGSKWKAFGAAVPNFSGRECQGFVDGRVMGEAMSLFTSMSIIRVAGTRRVWRGFQGWKLGEIEVVHSDAGGVMAQKEQLQHFYQMQESFALRWLWVGMRVWSSPRWKEAGNTAGRLRLVRS
jgi:hypothetical protein